MPLKNQPSNKLLNLVPPQTELQRLLKIKPLVSATLLTIRKANKQFNSHQEKNPNLYGSASTMRRKRNNNELSTKTTSNKSPKVTNPLIQLLTPILSKKKFKRILVQALNVQGQNPDLKKAVKPPIFRHKLCTILTFKIKSETFNKEPKTKNSC